MKLTESFSYEGADVEAVYALITDQAFRTESCANQGSMDYEVTVEPAGDGATVTVVRTQEADMPPTSPRFLTLADVAEVLNVTVRQVYALVRSGDLRGIQIGGRGQWRIENDQLEDYIARQYARAESPDDADERVSSNDDVTSDR